ncbi:MAG: hypothetical protein KAS73_15130 [Candidatus Sabulitectum sp.]|nr:hypothetical protein [Candidatus Sabulitectum sp.]
MSKVVTLIFAGFVLLFSSCGQGLADGTDGAVISVGERAIFPENVGESFERYRGDTLSVNIFKENIIARELFIVHAIDLGLDNDRVVVRLSHERAREILQAQWLSHSLDQVQIRQEDVLHFWQTMGTGISYTCFYDQDSILIDSVLTMVEDGESLSGLAAEIGMDAMLRQTRGQISIVDVNYSNAMDHDYLISARAGDIIPPFPVRLGWRMLQIDSTWTYTPDPFESDSQRIASMLLARTRESRKIFLEDSLKSIYNVQVDLDVVSLMAENADADHMMFGTFQPEEEALSAVTWDGGSRTLFSVTDNIMSLPGHLPRQTDDVQWLVDYSRRLALFDIQMEEAIKMGLDTIPDVARRLDAKHWEAVLDKYYEVVISARIVSDSVVINEVYMEIREDHPIEESRIFHTLFLANAERIQTAEAMMVSGDDILASMDQFEIFPPILAQDQETITIPLTAAMIPENDREALFNLLSGEEAIVVLSDSTAIWLRLDSINEERIPALEDIRGRVVSETEQRQETQAIEALVDSLSGVYHLYVDEEYFEGFYTPAEVDSVGLSTTEVI